MPTLQNPENNFSNEIAEFASSVDSLLNTFPDVSKTVSERTQKNTANFSNYLKIHGKKVSESNGQTTYHLTSSHAAEARKLRQAADKSIKAAVLIQRGFLITLISQYDAFLGRLIRLSLLSHPGRLNSSDRQISFKELLEMSSIDEAREALIDREVDAVIRKSHDDQLDWLSKTYRISLDTHIEERADFVEIAQRRHLFVHCDGRVSAQYIVKCKTIGLALPSGVSVGSQLEVTQEYLQQAFESVYAVGVKLGVVLWLKLHPEANGAVNQCINELALPLIVEERYKLATNLLSFGLEQPRDGSNDKHHRYQVMNLAQAYKWWGKPDECLALLNKHDWSSCDDTIQLGLRCLHDNFADAVRISKKLVHDETFSVDHYRQWPIFRAYINSDEFLAFFKESYGKDFAQEIAEGESSAIAAT
jgi:hypothetical protein